MARKFKIDLKPAKFGPNDIFGTADRDVLNGFWGDDCLFGYEGDDQLHGGKGNDRIDGGAGSDRIFGGQGEDTAVYAGGIADYELTNLKVNKKGPIKAQITDLATGDTDRLHGIEALYFASDDYTAYLDGRNNVVKAVDDAAEALADTDATISGLTDNDLDFDGDTLTVVSIDTSGLTGSAVLNPDGTITYSAGGAFDSLAEGDTAVTALTYTVTDGNGSFDTATVEITVTGVNDAPTLTLPEAVSIEENTTDVATAIGADVDNGDTLTYTISGDDAALFAIDPVTGVLTFANAPDFENPGDADSDNVYDLTVTVTDQGNLSASGDLAVTVTDVEEGPPPEYRINEFHYDNTGGDVGEFIEVRVTAGADVSGVELVLYNGSFGDVYGNIALPAAPSGGDADYDYYTVAVQGLQNGSPDGIALVRDGALIEFLSYEGSFMAIEGPAAGVTSEDIGVSESSATAIGQSLQRNDDGTWRAPETETPGAANIAAAAQLVITEIMQNPAAVSDAVGEYFEIFNAGTTDVDINGYTFSDNDVDSFVVDNGGPLIVAAGSYFVFGRNGDISVNGGVPVDYEYSGMFLANGADEIVITDTQGREIDRVEYDGGPGWPDPTGASMELIATDLDNNLGSNWEVADATFGSGDFGSPGASNNSVGGITLQINEFHYDNGGFDVGEFIEVAGTAGGDLSGWSIVLYNGSDGAVYNTILLSGALSDDGSGTGYASVDVPGMQNGAPDGIALVNPDGAVIEFLSYEGSMTAAEGPAVGLTSEDIGVSESGLTLVGQSLQRQADGTWAGPAENTRNAANDGSGPPPAVTTLISTIQGEGDASALVGQAVRVEAVVTAVVSGGFFLQEEDADADANALTSEGIFVSFGGAMTVSVGDVVSVTGTISEDATLTQLTSSALSILGTAALPTAAGLSLPFTMTAELEAVEGMRVSIAPDAGDAPLTIIETFNFDRFGEIVVSEGGQIQPTQIYDAQTQQTEIQALTAANAANRLILDDGSSSSNPTAFPYVANTSAGDNGNGILDVGDTFTADGPTLRIGAELTAPIEGVMSYSFGNYKVIPTETLAIDPLTNELARDATPPDVGGDLKVASFNVLNYFTTLGERGAQTAQDLVRQTDKIVTALTALDADIIGLQELENNGFGAGSAIAALVDALNSAAGFTQYAFVDPTMDGGPIGTDAITTGFIYQVDAVTVTGADFLVFDDGAEQRNRPAVAATFEDMNGGTVTIAVNHFKSKGASGLSAGDATNPDSDQGDGQGFWNATRTDAANQLTDWLAKDPTGSGDTDFLIIGDLNAYNEEDPVQAIEAAGYTNLIESFIGAEDAFSFVFNGQQGSLDTGLASASLASQITGVEEWHINALEPDLLDYSSRFNNEAFYNDDVFRSSDHDPLVIGLTLEPEFDPMG